MFVFCIEYNKQRIILRCISEAIGGDLILNFVPETGMRINYCAH